MKFLNKLELRYVFNEKSNYMDAVIRNRCEKEILTMVRALADMLDVRLMVYNEPVAAAPAEKVKTLAKEASQQGTR